MIFGNKRTIVENLKSYVASWPQKELVFSYELTCSVTPSGPQLTLKQKQTGFSLSMVIQPSSNSLRVSSFTLQEDPWLEDICQSLYDAALIELVLQSLTLSVSCAQYFNKEEVSFVISAEEAAHLSSLEDLFNSVSSHTTTEGKRQIFTVSAWAPYSDEFMDYANSMKTNLRQQLWTQQKSDSFLRRFLQRRDRLAVSLSSNSFDKIKQQPKPALGTVIPFPRVSGF